jgi:hypothetical protein
MSIPKDQLKEELKKIIRGEERPISGDSKTEVTIGTTKLLIDSPFISVEEIIKFVAFIHLADPPQTNIAKLRYGTEIGGINKAEFKDLQLPVEQQVWEPLFGTTPIIGIFGTGRRKKTRSRKHKRKTRRH